MTKLCSSPHAVSARAAVTGSHECASATPTATEPVRAMLAQLRAAGRRSTAPGVAGEALVAYWAFVREIPADQRRSLLEALQAAAHEDGLTARAWLPVALGEPQFDLASEAARRYLGGWPASVERRERGIADVTDWVVRSLALNRAALLFALLEQADAEGLERLLALCHRLRDEEARVALEACDRSGRTLLADFAAQWRAQLSSTPSPGPRAA